MKDRTLLSASIVTAFAASLLAVRERASVVEAGYRLASARAEGDVLRREAMRARNTLAWASSPQCVLDRAKRWGLGLDFTVAPKPTAAPVAAGGAR
ncbi:MAG: hypothetical protein HMLKMBBP_02150 [Planctomycetes bacterium]|nr:hypothetical protein [Planctomycetota bacterium]